MSLFSDILEKISTQIQSKHTDKELIAGVVSRVIGTTITPDSCIYSNKELRISAAPTIKLSIQFKQRDIIAALQEKGISVVSVR